jgi:extracellular factor (EF) 3-hydroxypalmitic acid methyl ester biosynthesis protein
MKILCPTKNYEEILPVIEKFGPDENEYQYLYQLVNSIRNEDECLAFRELIKPILNKNTMYGHGYEKPLGYSGDYLLIEKIYKEYVSEDPRFTKWDKHYQANGAAHAVRNRKSYFIKTLEQLYYLSVLPTKVLILGSGPATDVYEFFTKHPDADVSFDLLDIDQCAIDYAAKKNEKFLDKINFIRMNVLRFFPGKKYDLIWSAGLFDYLNDRLFTGLVRRFKDNLNLNGEMIIGNFSPGNPTKRIMEVVSDWYLIHRSNKQLTDIAVQAGIPRGSVHVDHEPLGINLFLRMAPRWVMPLHTVEKESKAAKKQAYSPAVTV